MEMEVLSCSSLDTLTKKKLLQGKHYFPFNNHLEHNDEMVQK
jgi:hypothetical protein